MIISWWMVSQCQCSLQEENRKKIFEFNNMNPNYFEKLAKLYEYPYAHGSDRTLASISRHRDPYFVQTVAAPNRIVPMHFSCPETKQLMCTCDSYLIQSSHDLFAFQSIANYLDSTLLKGAGPRYDRRAVHKVKAGFISSTFQNQSGFSTAGLSSARYRANDCVHKH